MHQVLLAALNWFLALSPLTRIIVGISCAFLAGPAFIGFLSEYATYAYAIRTGFRPPVEGVPYLAAVVVLGSILLASSLSIVFFVTRSSILLAANRLRKLSRALRGKLINQVAFILRIFNPSLSNIESLRRAIELFAQTRSARVLVTILLPLAWVMTLASSVVIMAPTIAFSLRFAVATVLILAAIMGLLSIMRPGVTAVMSAGVALSFYAFCLICLFTVSGYSSLLRSIGFGGGVCVEVTVERAGDIKSIKMDLFMRSRESLIGRFVDDFLFVELPISTVEQIRYFDSKLCSNTTKATQESEFSYSASRPSPTDVGGCGRQSSAP